MQKFKNPSIKIRLMGHSLGAQVILSTIQSLAKNSKNKGIIESVHLFGASIPANSMKLSYMVTSFKNCK